MIQYKKILFPILLSESSIKLIPHVKTIAHSLGADIHLLYVTKTSEYYVEDEKEPGKSITEKVQNYVNVYFKDIPNARLTVSGGGEVALEILSYIEKENIDMIIMAIKGKSSVGKVVFGSVAGQVSRSARVPVILINPQQDKFLE